MVCLLLLLLVNPISIQCQGNEENRAEIKARRARLGTKAARSLRIVLQRGQQCLAVKGGPGKGREEELGIGDLPEQEV